MLAGIPTLSNFSEEIKITLRIHSSSLSGFIFYVSSDIKEYQYISDLTISDLDKINNSLRSKLEDFIFKDPENKNGSLRELAEEGYNAFIKIFKGEDLREGLRQLNKSDRNAVILVISELFFIPWELLYFEKPKDSLLVENFWGLRLIISRLVARCNDTSSGLFASTAISYDTVPKFGLLTYKGLPSVSDIEIPYFNELERNGQISLSSLRELKSEDRDDEMEIVKTFCNNPFNVIHFACHAEYEEELKEAHILLSDNFSISTRDFENNHFKMEHSPLVILNACETGNLNPLYSSNLAKNFQSQGALGIVATEYEIPDDFAALFVQELYKYFLLGHPLGSSLLEARKNFLKEHQSPVGLLYSMYAAPNIHLKQLN